MTATLAQLLEQVEAERTSLNVASLAMNSGNRRGGPSQLHELFNLLKVDYPPHLSRYEH
jgi:hypothetical protein